MAFYKRNLPHWQPNDAVYFVTFRLAGSLPTNVVKELIQNRQEYLEKESTSGWQPEVQDLIQRKIFQKYESLLDGREKGPVWLEEGKIAETVQEAIHYCDQKEYVLYAYCIMSNHVHMVFKHMAKMETKQEPEDIYPVTNILRKLKRFTARKCNKILKREGAFWHPESYDRVIRNNNELEKTITYTLNNPVKAGLADYWEDWPHCYCKIDFINTFRN